MDSQAHLPAPRRIVASNLSLLEDSASQRHSELGVEGGSLLRTCVATVKRVATSNDGSGKIELSSVPGIEVVMPGRSLAPNPEGVLQRTTSQDYLFVLQGTLRLLISSNPFEVHDGRGTYSEPAAALYQSGEVVVQRGMMHALSNRTSKSVRLLYVVFV
ncbi:hypothetical protein F4779DRAFT_626601 [Xylariaceae sp. FL0662B]|nr:hypothetical protein F4779DRAFT_626601 [Xylariaceae sp. FL0662B]